MKPLTDTEFDRPRRPSALDAEIEKELEAAMAGLNEKAMYGLEEKRPPRAKEPGQDGPKKGRVISVRGDDIFLDIGGRSEGVIAADQFPDGPPEVGAEVEVTIEGYDKANGLLLLSKKGAAVHADWSTVAEGMVVEARVTGHNSGGLEVNVNGIRGFIPMSHIDLYRIEDAAPYVNQKFNCLVTDVNPEERNLVVSRRAILEKEREEAREKLWAELAEGQVRTGTVRNIREFGAFIDLGGVDGLLHISEMSWSRGKKAEELVNIGQELQVAVIKIDHENRKVGLGLKQLMPGPWDDIDMRYPTETVVTGKVTKLVDFGAFVELEPGLEGLVHISEMAAHRVAKPSDVVKPEQEVQVRVLSLDPAQKRIALSMKITKEAAEDAAAEEEQEAEPKKLRPRTTPLRGGL